MKLLCAYTGDYTMGYMGYRYYYPDSLTPDQQGVPDDIKSYWYKKFGRTVSALKAEDESLTGIIATLNKQLDDNDAVLFILSPSSRRFCTTLMEMYPEFKNYLVYYQPDDDLSYNERYHEKRLNVVIFSKKKCERIEE